MVLNAILAWILGFKLGYGHIGLALASSISAFFTVLVLLFLLKREQVYKPSSGWLNFWLRLVMASTLLIVFILYFEEETTYLREISGLGKILYILKMVMIGMALYFLTLRLTGMKIKDFLN